MYRRLGLHPVVGRRLVDADVLVLLRGVKACEIDCSGYQAVHVFNYVGQDYSTIRLTNVNRLLLVERQATLSLWRPRADRPPDVIVPGWHPVYPRLWKHRPRQPAIQASHVGNFKPIRDRHALDWSQHKLIECLSQNSMAVWGRGWKGCLPPRCIKGSISLWRVPALFSMTSATLGLRYPNQRRHDLISSRYWLAPLVGCPVVSDEQPLRETLPGVLFASYDIARSLTLSDPERKRLTDESEHFWQDRTLALERALAADLYNVRAVVPPGLTHMQMQATYRFGVWARRLKSATVDRFVW